MQLPYLHLANFSSVLVILDFASKVAFFSFRYSSRSLSKLCYYFYILLLFLYVIVFDV